jgi:DNA polymerase
VSILWLDTETFNETPITYGTYRYAETARVDIASYAIDDSPVQVIDFTEDDPHDVWMFQDLLKNAEIIIAHNAMFDRNVLRLGDLKIEVPIKKWRCSMVKALLHGLPGGLDKLCGILNVPQDLAKMKEGRALMMLFCKPQGKNRKVRIADRTTHPKEWAQYLDYAKHDISAMREVWKRLPSWNYSEAKGGALERDLWHFDQKVNDRGVCVDRPLVLAAIRATDAEQIRIKERTQDLTGYDPETGEGLESSTKRDRMLEFILQDYGVGLADLTKATIAKLLEEDALPPGLIELLRLRQQASQTSTAKYNAFNRGCNSDGRLRGMLQFSGAARTRRDCLAEGTLVAVRNQDGVTEKPIEKVLLTDEVWDGGDWVGHEGVVFSGEKEVVTYDGVTATLEHNVWLDDTTRVPLKEAIASGRKLWQGNRIYTESTG